VEEQFRDNLFGSFISLPSPYFPHILAYGAEESTRIIISDSMKLSSERRKTNIPLTEDLNDKTNSSEGTGTNVVIPPFWTSNLSAEKHRSHI
jgi:hypothetical protein